ncbi:DUF2793 domain-containing protein [Sandarakinorhabdus sp.]|uniref:DUF2793 domain-containing protein n=1 Tax=Sandarakinorhabdus sp. TaxID=1916663 RepID=UPI00286E9683|nr:DUF2793 domain-containing protein [Sandarakinorhabdus sp.]
MPETTRLRLPLLAAGQAQKEITHNEAIAQLDRLMHITVISRELTSPPAEPDAGDSYIVPFSGTALWGAPAGTLMSWDGFGWQATTPITGMVAYVVTDAATTIFAAGWQAGWPVSHLMIGARAVLGATPASVVPPNGGAVVDAEARAVLGMLLAALSAQGIII